MSFSSTSSTKPTSWPASSYAVKQFVFPALVLLAAVAAVVVAYRATGRWRTLAVGVLPLLVMVEAVALAEPFLPRVPKSRFYRHSLHEFLADHIGSDRCAASGLTMWPGTNTWYRLRAVTGHLYHQPTWADLLREVNPNAFAASPTFSTLASTESTFTSPVLDRMAAQWMVTDPAVDPPGRRETLSEPSGFERVEEGDVLRFDVPPDRSAPSSSPSASRRRSGMRTPRSSTSRCEPRRRDGCQRSPAHRALA